METTPVVPDVAEKPKVTSTHALRPLGPTSNQHCVVCKQQTAHWSIMHARYGQENICALCFLYDSGWLDSPETKAAVSRVANVLGLKRGKVLERVEGRFVQVRDADDVLGAITLHERFESITRKRA